VVTELIRTLLPRLESVNGQIVSVTLKKGELRILSDHALKHAFEIVALETQLEGAVLKIEEVKASICCRSCGYTGKAGYLKDEAFHFVIPVLTCPHCGSEVDVVSGRELYVDRGSVASPEAPAKPSPAE